MQYNGLLILQKKYFTHNSIFINTDDDPNWILLGSFDYSNKKLGFCPKNIPYPENQTKQIQYRIVTENMCKSKFVLCPIGDSSWSFRFYEVLILR